MSVTSSPQSASEPPLEPSIPSMDTGESSTNLPTEVEDGSRPEVDGPTNMTAYHLEMDIESVFYFRHRARACCAILINTVFCLRDGMLELAEIPLSFIPSKAEDGSEISIGAIDVQKFHPNTEERVEVCRRNVKEDIFMAPVISFPLPGSVQVRVSGLGKHKFRSGPESYQISMFGMRHHRNRARSASLTWRYEDQHGFYYPKSTRTLVVVEKEGSERTFSFDMYLSPEMFVDIHGKFWARRFVGLAKKPDEGWTFHIAGNYNRQAAQNAVQEMHNTEESNGFILTICGLRAAAVQYLQNILNPVEALSPPVSQSQPA